MSNGERDPQELVAVPEACTAGLEILTPRDVPLGGPRAMTVRRTLPQKRRSLIGPWCFVDHFGPDDVSATGGMAVPRHPHTGLATVTLLFAGQIDHLDSKGFANTVRPGEVNLMIAGRGVSHSEFSTRATTTLHGVQLWYALPDALRDGPAQSQHHVPRLTPIEGGTVLPYLGHVAGASSPVDTRTPALAAEIQIEARRSVEITLDPEFEHGLLLDRGDVRIEANRTAHTEVDARSPLAHDELLYLPRGARRVRVTSRSDETSRVLLIGGPPLLEDIVMWWNFVGRSHQDIVTFRDTWQNDIDSPDQLGDEPSRFGPFPAGTPAALPAPTLPHAEIRPRRHPERPSHE